MLVLRDKKIPARVSIGAVRNAKAHHGVDLGAIEDGTFAEFTTSIIALSDVIWAMYETQLKSAGITDKDTLDEHLEESDLDEIREEFSKAIRGFFPLTWMAYMRMREMQDGDPNEKREGETE